MINNFALQDDETKELLNFDFEVGQTIRDRIIPRAVLYYTGEAHDDDDEDVSSFLHAHLVLLLL